MTDLLFAPILSAAAPEHLTQLMGPAGTLIVWVLLVLAIGVAFCRLLLGPSLADRVIVLDLLASLAQGTLAVYAILTREPALLDVAIAIALLSFLGTIAFARYIERNADAQGVSGHD